MNSHTYGDGTRVIRSSSTLAVPGRPLHNGPVFAAPFHLADAEPGVNGADVYARYDNPTLREFETSVGELDGGRALAFASGMAALSAVFYGCLSAGQRLLIPSDGYFTARLLADAHLRRFEIEVAVVATAEVERRVRAGDFPGANLILVETPSNPVLDVCDIAAIAEITHAQGGLLAVDNTTATPLGQRPLALGADLVVASDTKALAGHSDLLLGHVTVGDDELFASMKSWRDQTGAIPGPFETWLAHRSMGTLDMRLARQSENAAALAELLAANPQVTDVRWPWRAGDPSYEIARRQMLRPMGVVSASLASADAVRRLLAASKLLTAATSFGGLHTTVDRRAQFGDSVAEGFIRISCGCEDTVDLVHDLTCALQAIADD
ncbi:MAG: cystathionine gamma-lyase [Geodermatophilaceae bacterium]|nr:cystathionine gamma-lyase [Geodermatophilaceae bacterium]